jgi:ATP/maltotriose-dependent transcriptional regulator MalT
VRLVGDRGSPVQRAQALAGLAQMLMILADFSEATGYARQAIELAVMAGEPSIESHALCTLGTVVSYEGDLDAGLEMLRRALDLAQRLRRDDDVGRAVANIVDVQVICGQFADAVKSATRALEMQPPLSGVWAVLSSTDAAWALYASGDWDQALDMLDRARMHPAAGAGEIEWVLRRAQLLVGRGEFADADRYFETLDRLLETSADTQWIAPAATAAAERAIWRADFPAACLAIDRALDRVRPSSGANVSRIGPMLAMGMRAAADESLQRSPQPHSPAYADRFLSHMRAIHGEVAERWPRHLRLAEPWLALCEAEASRMAGRSDPELWATAVRCFEDLPMPYPAAYALYRTASAMLAGRRDSAAGRDALRRAAATSRLLSARPLLAEIEDLAARANVQLDAPSAGKVNVRPAGLSERELEVLGLIAAGMTNREIGDRLFITPKTASHHVSSVLGKLGVRTRSEAAAEAVRMSLEAGGSHRTPVRTEQPN